MPGFKYNIDFVPVPKDFIEHIMPAANPAYVMVYLYILSLGACGKSMDTADIAKKLNFIETDVVNAIKYWKKQGLLAGSDENIIIKKSVDEELSPENDKKSIDDIEAAINGNQTLADLCAIAQEILGKTLSNNDIQILYWFYDGLGFSPEVITMLLEYCVSLGKRNMKYIEKVAITWMENKITTMDEAQQYITRASKSDEFTTSLRKLFGITDRNLSKTEALYLDTWRDDYKMSADMVGLAYEYCIMATNKLSFPYINTILKRWNEQGIRTIPEAEKDHEEYKQNGGSNSGNNNTAMSDTEDISEIEKQFMSNYENN
ncbi:MAG: DnaD domain protein [Candidatus Ornithomonoglobus sp.]